MLNAYSFVNKRLVPVEPDDAVRLGETLWVDLVEPTSEERSKVKTLYRHHLPDAEDVEEIEASARSYLDEEGVHIHTLFLHDVDGRSRNTSVAFTLRENWLFSLRDREIPAFRLLRMRGRRELDSTTDAAAVLLTLFEIKIEDLADTLEEVHTDLEKVSAKVLEEEGEDLEEAIEELTRCEDINGKVRLCLMDTQRALSFLLRHGRFLPENRELAGELLRDVDSLLPHNNFVFEKINFLMDAAQGFINIEQNQIIKIFSIAAVVFLPPTLVASIYGMNFQYLPELHWAMGYPWALALMVVSGIAPYLYFKHKGWL